MDEKTTTEAPVETGAETALPVQTENAPAAEATETNTAEQEQHQEGEQSSSLPTEDEKLQKFAQSHGLELDSPNAIKAAKMAMDNQAEFQRNRQKATELEKTLSTTSDQIAEEVAESTGQDPELLKRLQRVEVKEAVRDFWNTPDEHGSVPDKAYEPAMIKLLQDKPHLAGDLDSLYATAVMKSGALTNAKSQGKREALESLAHKQQAAVPTGNATNSGTTSKDKPFAEKSIAEMEAQLGFARV